MRGDNVRSAALLSDLAATRPDDTELGRKALAEALNAGQVPLALKLARSLPPEKLTSEARLLLAGDEIRRRRPDRAYPWLRVKGDTGDLTFIEPLINAWTAAERGQADISLGTIDAIPTNSLLGPLKAEERAFILLKFRRTAEAEPFARRAIGAAGGREVRIRLALADAFVAAGDRARAAIMLEGLGADAPIAQQQILAGRQIGQAIDSLPEALGEALTAFAADLVRSQRAAAPIGLVQVARYVDPQNSSTAMLLALLLQDQGRADEGLAVLRALPRDDALASQIRDVQVRVLSDEDRFNEAYAIAAAAAAATGAGIEDYSRLGSLLQDMKRYPESADAYGRAIALANARNIKTDMWSLLLLRASALEEINRWPEARGLLEQALQIAPEQPLILNFLGYGKLERGEDLDAAEAMIRKASDLAPDDASITDSLGWAQYKRGKIADAIATLQTAAEKDPDQAEIHEHLGDALFSSGRRFEARFAWNAALVTAEDKTAARVKAKLASGLTPANAAP